MYVTGCEDASCSEAIDQEELDSMINCWCVGVNPFAPSGASTPTLGAYPTCCKIAITKLFYDKDRDSYYYYYDE